MCMNPKINYTTPSKSIFLKMKKTNGIKLAKREVEGSCFSPFETPRNESIDIDKLVVTYQYKFHSICRPSSSPSRLVRLSRSPMWSFWRRTALKTTPSWRRWTTRRSSIRRRYSETSWHYLPRRSFRKRWVTGGVVLFYREIRGWHFGCKLRSVKHRQTVMQCGLN